MSGMIRYTLLILMVLGVSPTAFGQFHDADPEAEKAFAEMVRVYRERPGLKVKSKVRIEIAEDDAEASSIEVEGAFLFGGDRKAIVKLRDLTCYLADGTISAVHEENGDAYFTMSDDGSPYYALMAMFVSMPYPHLAIMLGEEAMEDLYMQFHPQAPWARPTGLTRAVRDGKEVQIIRMTSDFERMDVVVDAQSKLIERINLEITGGQLVRAGATMKYVHTFGYETYDEPLGDGAFVLDTGERKKVDMLAELRPERDRRGVLGGPILGKEAPPLVLATIDGGAIDLESLRGQVVVIDFWATWCQPCVAALPLLHDVARWASDQMLPVTVFTVNTFEIPNVDQNTPDARLAQASEFWEEHRFSLRVAMDYTDEVAAAYGVGGIPTTIIIRSDGVVHSKHVGAGRTYVEDLKRDIVAAIEALEQKEDE